jgi:LysR family transcriptional activator of nhaA
MNAAKALKIAQPSLSTQLKTLESNLNLTLFHKVGRCLELTPDGERAFAYCRKMFEVAEEFADHLKHSGTTRNERCRIGITTEIERPFIADILSTILREKQPHEQPLLSMLSYEHSALMENLRSRDLDVIVTNHPMYGPDIRVLAELSMPVVAVGSPLFINNFLQKNQESLAKSLKKKDIGFILPSERLKIRIETDLFLQKMNLRNRIVLESDILPVVVRAAIDGVGVAFLPQHYIARELEHEELALIGKGTALWQHTIFIASHNTKNLDPTVNEIKQHFMNLGANPPPT